MKNLLTEAIAPGDLKRIFDSSPPAPSLPLFGAAPWQQAAANPSVGAWMEPIRALARQELELPDLGDALYRDFFASGRRQTFDAAYASRRRMLGRAALALLLERGTDHGFWIDSVQTKLGAILSEFSWALPASVNTPSGKDPMHLDICATETAHLLSELVSVLESMLPADLVVRVRSRIEEQVIENYLHRREDFFWTKSRDHWNAACHHGVLGSALTFVGDGERLARLFLAAKPSLNFFLQGFGADGVCEEGASYWQRGFGTFARLNAHLEQRTGGELSLFEGDSRVRSIARFGPSVTLSSFQLVNFGDAPRSGVLDPALLGYLGQRLGDEWLLGHCSRNYSRLVETGIDPYAQDFPFMANLCLGCPVPRALEALGGSLALPADVHFPEAGLVIARGKDGKGNLWEFAAKGGHNGELHNHNDCGSFILNVNGMPIALEIGAPVYSRDFFQEKRYEFLAARSLGHSVPVVNGFEQMAGTQFASKILSCQLTNEHVVYSIDLTACYPSAAQCTDLVRSFYFDKQLGRLRVKEQYELAVQESFETALVTDRPLEIDPDRTILLDCGGFKIRVRAFEATAFAGCEEQEYRDHAGIARKINRLVFVPHDVKQQKFVGYELEMA